MCREGTGTMDLGGDVQGAVRDMEIADDQYEEGHRGGEIAIGLIPRMYLWICWGRKAYVR